MTSRVIEVAPLPTRDGFSVIVPPPIPDEPLDAELPDYDLSLIHI
ncbi:hypothetical protein [Sphingobium sp. B2]|nr:hypothetical protein [Sphingobium sp. B2]